MFLESYVYGMFVGVYLVGVLFMLLVGFVMLFFVC